MIKFITTTILPLIFFTTTVFAQSSSTYKVVIDNCHSSIINEGTPNTITVEFLNGNRVVGKSPKKGIIECASNATFSIKSNENITGVNVTTNGDNGYYIDKIELYKNEKLVKRYGDDNGQGWCLSTDPGDANGDWEGTTVNGCKASQFFGYPVSSSSSSSSQTTGEEYKVVIDNCHSSIINEGTPNTITVEFLNGNRVLGKSLKKGIIECSSNATFSIKSNENITGVNVTTNGDNGYYIDKIELYKNGKLVKRYGDNNGQGWCLSTDPGDANGDWEGTTVNGCKASQFFGYPSSGSSQTTGTQDDQSSNNSGNNNQPTTTTPDTSIPITGNIIFQNGNRYTVFNGTKNNTYFYVWETTVISSILNYHWNNGKGSRPGQIGLRNTRGLELGNWQATGSDGMRGVKNANWTVYPNITLQPGIYQITDSEIGTWSQNSGSYGAGFSIVKAR